MYTLLSDRSQFRWLALWGGLATAVIAPVSVQAQTIQQSGTAVGGEVPHLIEQVPWFNNPDVRNQIKINDDQYNRLYADYNRYWKLYNTNRSKLDTELAEEEREEREYDLYRQFQQNLSQSLDRILTDRVSRRRYDELYNQYLGYRAFHNPRVQRQLDLTSEQLHELRVLDLEWQKELTTIRAHFEINRPVAMRQLKHARRQMHDRILELLTPEQQEKWAALTGERYEFPAQVYVPPPPQPGIKASQAAGTETP